jgi:hypothetical protein
MDQTKRYEEQDKEYALASLGYQEIKPNYSEHGIINALHTICRTLGLRFEDYFEPNYDHCTKEGFKKFCIVVANSIAFSGR